MKANLSLLMALPMFGGSALMAAPEPTSEPIPKKPVPSDVQSAKIAAANAKRARKAAKRRRSI